LERASLSVVLNVAEGAGRRTPAQKVQFYDVAMGSATECLGAIAVIGSLKLARADRLAEARGLIERVIMMLHRLIARHAANA
jgi:four helix bundle protein